MSAFGGKADIAQTSENVGFLTLFKHDPSRLAAAQKGEA
jgi:hypothetical protein